MTYHYRAFGLTICSSLPIPELIPVQGEPDVTIGFAAVPDALEAPKSTRLRFQSRPGQLLLKVDNIAKYLVSNGREITIDPFPGAEPEGIRLFLLGSALGAILHQRGIFPLHASAVKVDHHCVIFCGASGYGKSTTANILVKRGYPLHADDICAIGTNNEGVPQVFPEYPHLKLWEDSLVESGETSSNYTRVRHVLNKFSVPAQRDFYSAPLPIKKIYILSPQNQGEISISPLKGMAKFNALKNHTYRRKFIDGLGNEAIHFKTAGDIGQKVPVLLVQRPRKPFLLNQLADLLEEDFG
jgi:hypothetical protein